MELKKLSASSLQAADMCLARYYAESKAGYGATIRNDYARLGSSVHGALEDLVKLCFIEKKAYANKDFLIAYYKKHFMANFETAELSGDWYDQGIEMLDSWYEHMTSRTLKFNQWSRRSFLKSILVLARFHLTT